MIIFVAAILFMIPISNGVYDFRTDQKTDQFYVNTAATTTANVTLLKSLYNADISTISMFSTDSPDVPVVVSYNATNRVLNVGGLATSSNRTLDVSYDYDALGSSSAINLFLDKVAWIWLLCVIAFAPAALIAIFKRKD
jgi:hypothetical protein